MALRPKFFGRPGVTPIALRVQPRLASWMTAGHPDQVRLEAFLADAEELTRPLLHELTDPLALSIDVGLPSHTPLLAAHDLDNYALPLATRLSRQGNRRIVSVWCTKRHNDTSYIAVAEATPSKEPPVATAWHEVRTSASTDTAAYKQQISRSAARGHPNRGGGRAARQLHGRPHEELAEPLANNRLPGGDTRPLHARPTLAPAGRPHH